MHMYPLVIDFVDYPEKYPVDVFPCHYALDPRTFLWCSSEETLSSEIFHQIYKM